MSLLSAFFRRLRPDLALAFAFVGSAAGTTAAGTVGSFASLPATDTVHVRVQSAGSSGSTACEFTLRRGKDGVVLVATGIERRFLSGKQGYEDAGRRLLGQILLSDADLRALDRYVIFHRANPPGAGERVFYVTITQERVGQATRSEQLIDRSGGRGLPPGARSFLDFLDRAAKSEG